MLPALSARRLRTVGWLQIRVCLATMALTALLPQAVRAQTVSLHGNHPAKAANLTSRAAADRQLHLETTFAPRNRAALTQLLTDLQDPSSPRYHHWLTPTRFNARFGRTSSEVAAVRTWLRSQGFRITHESARQIGAAATVAQTENAFHVEILASTDGSVYGNSADPEIPQQLAEIIGSIGGLDNMLHSAPLGAAESLPGQSDYSGAYGTAFGPSDLWTFYDETPLLSNGVNGGGGDCIAFVEDSDYLDSAVTTFDTTFNLPTPTITRVFPDGTNPGRNGDEIEALLDIEWGHAAAPGAPIYVYIGASLQDAISRAFSDNKCGAISISYGYRGGSSPFYTSTLDGYFSQAAADGQSIFVSTGDQGAAELVLSGSSCATGTSLNVSEMAADTYVTAVGGTQFYPNYSSTGSDIGSVAESVWDDPSGAGGGGKSKYFSKPSYQNGGTPNDGARDLPDVSNAASPYYPGFYFTNDVGGGAAVGRLVEARRPDREGARRQHEYPHLSALPAGFVAIGAARRNLGRQQL